jgi:hypothetical protein
MMNFCGKSFNKKYSWSVKKSRFLYEDNETFYDYKWSLLSASNVSLYTIFIICFILYNYYMCWTIIYNLFVLDIITNI